MPTRRSEAAGSDPRETTPGYAPPTSSEAHEWWALAIKFAAALYLSALACSLAGFADATTAVIAAGFLVATPPVAALRMTIYRIIGMLAGAALGIAGALWGLSTGNQVPPTFYLGFGAVVGILASQKGALTYTVAIGAVVATIGASGNDPLPEVVAETCLQLLFGSAAAIGVLWTFEKARAVWASRHG